MNAYLRPASAGALLLALAACNGTTPSPSAGEPTSAGSAGPAYCESPPADPSGLEQWNKVCFPGK